MVRTVSAAAFLGLLVSQPAYADKPFDGMVLNLASQNDQFAPVMAAMAPEFKAQTGITVKVDILSYPELLTKATADFVAKSHEYDLVTMDIVWAGQFAAGGYSVDLTDRMKRDAAEIDAGDIYPVVMQALGQYGGKQVAYPFAGYAQVLAYRKDLYAQAGLAPPQSMEELVVDAGKLTDVARHRYGWVANGQKGPAVAQDWMQYNAEMGGAILGADGKPALNSAANVQSLTVYKTLFDQTTPPGAVDYDWGGREESFRQGLVANEETWSVGAASYDNPDQSRIVGQVGVMVAPPGKGLAKRYGVGGWGLAINADSDARTQEAAWSFIKWITSAPIQKRMALAGSGSYTRRSVLADPELNTKFPFLPVIATSFEHGDGDFRPRIPQYPQIQDLLGSAVNAVLVGGMDPKAALDDAQAKAAKLF